MVRGLLFGVSVACSSVVRNAGSDVAYWHLADVGCCLLNVRYWEERTSKIRCLRSAFDPNGRLDRDGVHLALLAPSENGV